MFSQNGEDGVLHRLIHGLGIDRQLFVEFGVESGSGCNTRLLAEVFGWSGWYFEPDAKAFEALARRYHSTSRIRCLPDAVTPATVNPLFRHNGLPERFGVLSIDVDGQDYWIWEALDAAFRPDVVVIECNTAFPRDQRVVEAPGHPWSNQHVDTCLGRR